MPRTTIKQIEKKTIKGTQEVVAPTKDNFGIATAEKTPENKTKSPLVDYQSEEEESNPSY